MFRVRRLFTILVFPFLAFAFPGSADFNYTISKPYPEIEGAKYYFTDGQYIVAVKFGKKAVFIQRFDAKKLTLLSTEEYTDFPEKYVGEAIEQFGRKIYVLYSLWDKKAEKDQLFCREVNFTNGTFKGDAQLILSVPGKLSGERIGWAVTNKFDFFSNYDGRRILIKYRRVPEERRDAKSFDKLGLFVFDNDMKKIWGHEVTMPYTEKKMNNIDFGIDSESNVYMLTTVFDDNSTKREKDGKANFHIELMRVKANTTKVGINKIYLNKKFIDSIKLYETPGNYMICGGYYNVDNVVGSAAGFYLFRANADGTMGRVVSYSFPEEMMLAYTDIKDKKVDKMLDGTRSGDTESGLRSTKADNKKKKGDDNEEENPEEDKLELTNLDLREIVVQEDGGIVVVGEEYFYTIRVDCGTGKNQTTSYYTCNATCGTFRPGVSGLSLNLSGGGLSTCRERISSYSYGDLIISRIDSAGELLWTKKVPKTQKGIRQHELGYKYFSDAQNNHYFLFIDNPKNLTLGTNEKPFRQFGTRNGFLSAAKLTDKDGSYSRSSIFDLENAKGVELNEFGCNRIVPLDSASFALEFYKKDKEDVWVKVNLGKVKDSKKKK